MCCLRWDDFLKDLSQTVHGYCLGVSLSSFCKGSSCCVGAAGCSLSTVSASSASNMVTSL